MWLAGIGVSMWGGLARGAVQLEEDVPGDQQHMIALNAELSAKWPTISKSKGALPDADDWKDRTGKLPQLER